MEQRDKQHLQNIDKVEIHNHNHVDTEEIISQLHIIKMQNNKIITLLLSSDELEKQMDSWLAALSKSVGAIEKVSEQVDSSLNIK